MTKSHKVIKLSLNYYNFEFDFCLRFVRQRRDFAKGGFFVIWDLQPKIFVEKLCL
jgi:hypothetical protein